MVTVSAAAVEPVLVMVVDTDEGVVRTLMESLPLPPSAVRVARPAPGLGLLTVMVSAPSRALTVTAVLLAKLTGAKVLLLPLLTWVVLRLLTVGPSTRLTASAELVPLTV